MSNLLNPLAAAGALFRGNSDLISEQKPDPQALRRMGSVEWAYKNCCYFGMQIQRYAKRYARHARRVFHPVLAAAGAGWKKAKVPAAMARDSVRSISIDTRKAFSRIAAAKPQGIGAMASTTGRSISLGVSKHWVFLRTVINYTLPVICIAVLITVALGIFRRDYALAVECDGQTVGYIAEESTYIEASSLIGERVIATSDRFKQALKPTYSLVAVNKSSLNTAGEICETFLQNSDDVDEGYGFFLNDRLLGVVKSPGDLDYILDEFLDKYRTGEPNEIVNFVGEIKITEGFYAAEKIVPSSDFKSAISTTEKITKLHTVSKNASLQKILTEYDMTEERFLELNSGFDGTLKANSAVVVEKEQPVLTVQSVVVNSYEAPIAFTTETQQDPNKYNDYKSLKTKGVPGVQLVTQQITRIDGVEVSRTVLSRETLVEPVAEVYIVGTKVRTTTKKSSGGSYTYTAPPGGFVDNSGSWTWPLPGVNVISSPFGYRWGRLHSGVDIANGNTYGRTIVAAKGGTVTMVKNQSSGYGLHLTISHGNGYSTLYAHCSEILVSAGQTVSKGQPIARVGNSGSSTGAHLHFEIRVNGTATNPMGYFN